MWPWPCGLLHLPNVPRFSASLRAGLCRRWLAENSWRFGYLLRYEKGQTSVTGVGFEPWHFRYVGTSLARAYHEGGWRTYEQFLGQPAAPTY